MSMYKHSIWKRSLSVMIVIINSLKKMDSLFFRRLSAFCSKGTGIFHLNTPGVSMSMTVNVYCRFHSRPQVSPTLYSPVIPRDVSSLCLVLSILFVVIISPPWFIYSIT